MKALKPKFIDTYHETYNRCLLDNQHPYAFLTEGAISATICAQVALTQISIINHLPGEYLF